jgi:hypothetical protein
MMFFRFFTITAILICSCKDHPSVKPVAGNPLKAPDTVAKVESTPPLLEVTAHLVYDDNTLSDFDVLNDKTKALWNTIIGAGDAVKPSEKVQIDVRGNLDSLHIQVKNGRKVVIDRDLDLTKGDMEYTIGQTGCEEIYVNVRRNKALLYRDTIPFHCGE